MPKLLITGANGQLGQSFQQEIKNHPSCKAIFFEKRQLDITHSPKLTETIEKYQPDFIVNCAAYTLVDEAEKQKELAYKINTEALGIIGKTAAQFQIPVLHFSSDYVYHNQLNRPLTEEDPTTPSGVYAQSKLAGEKLLLNHQPNSLIFRTSWVFSPFGKNFLKTMYRLATQKKDLSVVSDQIGAPTYAPFMAGDILKLVQKIYSKPNQFEMQFGIYNYCPEGVCSWYDFAYFIFKQMGAAPNLQAVPSEAYPTPVKRPHYSVMNTHKFKSTFGIELHHWEQGVVKCLQALG